MSRLGEDAAPTKIILTPRARRLAQWLADLSDTSQWHKFREASADMLLRELPDHWTTEDCQRESARVREQLGPKASHAQWLSAMGWLVGEREQLPTRPPQRMTDAARFATQRRVQDLLAQLTRRP